MEDNEDTPPAEMPRIEGQPVDLAQRDDSSSDSDSSSDGDSDSGDSSSSSSSSSSASSSEGQEEEEEEEEEGQSWIEVPDAESPSNLMPVIVDATDAKEGGKDGLEQLDLNLTHNGDAGEEANGDEAQFHVNLDFFGDSGNGTGPVDPVFVDDNDHGHGDHAAAAAEFDRLEQEIDSYCKSGEASAASSPPSLGLPTEKPDCDAVSPPSATESSPVPPTPTAETPLSAPLPPPTPPPSSPPKSPPPPPPPPPRDERKSIKPPPPPPAVPSCSKSTPQSAKHNSNSITQSTGDPILGEDEQYEDFTDSDDDSFMEEEHQLLEQDVETPAKDEKEENPRPTFKKLVTFFDCPEMENRGKNKESPLPPGWLVVRHISGMPVYLHKESRVCSITRPYFIGPHSLRKHKIPMTSVPCLNAQFRQKHFGNEVAKDNAVKEDPAAATPEKHKAEGKGAKTKNPLTGSLVNCSVLKTHLTAGEFREYCKKRIPHQMKEITRFRNWRETRHSRRQRVMQFREAEVAEAAAKSEEEKPNLKRPHPNGHPYRRSPKKARGPKGGNDAPAGMLIKIPVVEMKGINGEEADKVNPINRQVVKKGKKNWYVNPAHKTPICVLHEYVQLTLRAYPNYIETTTDSSATPFCTTVEVQGVKYGTGYGSSKRSAKAEAAAKSLEILIPGYAQNKANLEANANNLSLFNNIRIEDPRVESLCHAMSEPAPYAILLTCLRKNWGLVSSNLTSSIAPKLNKMNEFTLKVTMNSSVREVTVTCKNKRDGKHLAAQKLLQLIHPNVQYWSQILQMYGSRALMQQKLKKEQESAVTTLQNRDASRPVPSLAILEKLKEEMRKLSKIRKEVDNGGFEAGKFLKPIDPKAPATPGLREGRIDLSGLENQGLKPEQSSC